MLYSRLRMPWRIGLYALLGLSCLIAVYGWARSSGEDDGIDVRNRAELLEAVREARGPVTLRLAPGNYGWVNLANLGTKLAPGERITLMSADPCNRATFARLKITGSAGLVLKDLRFENTGFFTQSMDKILRPDGALRHMDLLRTEDSTHLVIADNIFVGTTIKVPSVHPLNGYPHGIGWIGRNVSDVEFTGNRMSNLFKGATLNTVQSVRIADNNITDYRSDALYVQGANDLTIQNNAFTDPRPYMLTQGRGDHPDFIQIQNIDKGRIENNYMVVGPDAGMSQGIFPGPARDLIVRNNIIIARSLNGILFRDIADSQIINNVLLKAENPASSLIAMDGERLPDVEPEIRITAGMPNVEVRDNASSSAGPLRRRSRRGRNPMLGADTAVGIRPFMRVIPGVPTTTGYRQIGDILLDENSIADVGLDVGKFAYLSTLLQDTDTRCPARV